MTIKQAIKILIRANKWRRGAEIEMPDPKEFGEAIDVAIVMMEVALKTDPVLNRHNIHTKRYEQ
jgi:hypothetical protein